MPKIPDKVIHLEDLPTDPRAVSTNWKILSPRAKRQVRKLLKLKKNKAKIKATESINSLRSDRDSVVHIALAQSTAYSHLEAVNSKLNQSNQNSDSQVEALTKIVGNLQLEIVKKDQKIESLEKRLENCTCQKSTSTGWQNTFNSNRRVKKQNMFDGQNSKFDVWY